MITIDRNSKESILEDQFWEWYGNIESQHDELNWEISISKLKTLREIALKAKLPHILSLFCQLKIMNIFANHGGLGHTYQVIQNLESIRPEIDYNSEPSLAIRFMTVEGLALSQMDSLMQKASQIYKSALDLAKARGIVEKDTIEVRRLLAEILSKMGDYKTAISLLNKVKYDSLDRGRERDVLLTEIRFAAAYQYANQASRGTEHLESSILLKSQLGSDNLPGEHVRIKLIQDRIHALHLILCEKDLLSAHSILEEAIRISRQYGYSIQTTKLLHIQEQLELLN